MNKLVQSLNIDTTCDMLTSFQNFHHSHRSPARMAVRLLSGLRYAQGSLMCPSDHWWSFPNQILGGAGKFLDCHRLPFEDFVVLVSTSCQNGYSATSSEWQSLPSLLYHMSRKTLASAVWSRQEWHRWSWPVKTRTWRLMGKFPKVSTRDQSLFVIS